MAEDRRIAGGGLVWYLIAAALIVLIGAMAGVYLSTLDWSRPVTPEMIQARFEDLAQRSQRAIQRDKPQTALPEVEAFVDEHKTFAPGHRLLGQVHVAIAERAYRRQTRTKHHQSALDAWAHSLELQPEQRGLPLLIGDLALKIKQPRRAEGFFRLGAGIEPDNADYPVRIAVALAEAGELDEARKLALDVLSRDASNHEAYYALAVIAERQGYHEMAVQQLDKALKHVQEQPQDRRDIEVKYLRRKGRVLLLLGAPARAVQTLKPPLGLSTIELRQFENNRELALAYAQQGNPELAAAHYETQFGKEGIDWRWVAEACRWRVKAGDFVRAAAHLEKLKQALHQLGVDVELEQAIEELQGQLAAASQRDKAANGDGESN